MTESAPLRTALNELCEFDVRYTARGLIAYCSKCIFETLIRTQDASLERGFKLIFLHRIIGMV